jgi:predicted ATPase
VVFSQQNLQAAKLGDEGTWTVSRYREEMHSGDQVILWQGGSNAGVYAYGELVGEPFERDLPSWRPTTQNGAEKEWAIGYRYSGILEEPIRKETLLEHPVLRRMQVLRAPQGTNFRVTQEEWEALRTLFDGNDLTEEDYSEPDFDQILSAVLQQGIRISERSLRRYHLGLKSRGFVILSGLSGAGKTWLTEAYARAVGAEYVVVPVAPNWTTNEDLLGYFNPLDDQYRDTQFSRFLRAAAAEYERAQSEGGTAKPYHLILDEMNLARVEYYFAKFLSGMEVRVRYGTGTIELGPQEQVLLPPNLRFAGTVNVDETTHGFADKLYDRAQLIELEVSREAILEHTGEAPYRDVLMEVWDVAYPVAPFAFRVLHEIAVYVNDAEALGVTWQEALDEQLLQKVLPKLKGTDIRVSEALERLVTLTEGEFPLSHSKTTKMLDEFRQHGFASYF